MSIIFPDATPVLGNVKVKACLAIADLAAPKLATEINAVSSVDLSCFLRPFTPGITTGSGAAPNRLCSTITLPQRGRTEFASFDLSYVYDPQAPDTAVNNKAKALLLPGTVLFFVIRKGLDARGVDYAVGQRTEIWRVRVDRQNRVTSGDGDQDEFQITQSAFPLAPPNEDGVIAA